MSTEKTLKAFLQQSRRTLALFLNVTPDVIRNMRDSRDLEPVLEKRITAIGASAAGAWLDTQLAPTPRVRPVQPTPEPHVVQLAQDIKALPDAQIATFFGVAPYQITRLRNAGSFVPEIVPYIHAFGYTTTKNRIGL